ncbi:MAG TPA: hypothetical protein VE910_02195 [Dongiaceae bacterium]|nr:hypothetical protein [Dongiaceae bacterium]
MTRIFLLLLVTVLFTACQRRAERETSQTTAHTKGSDTTVADNPPNSSPPDTVRIVTGTGLVLHVDLEGGFYGIVDDLGERYDPSNMPEDFKVDSLRVHYQATLTDKVSTHMWGRPVDIVTIERLD